MAPPIGHTFSAMGSASTLYVFKNAGDELPLHVHQNYEHISVVCHGDVEFFDDKGKRVQKSIASAMIFRAGRPHGIRALSAGAIVHNVISSVNPMPLPADALQV